MDKFDNSSTLSNDIKVKLLQAQTLIKQKNYDDARKILQAINHPKAKELLEKLSRFSANQSSVSSTLANPSEFELFVEKYRKQIPKRNTLLWVLTGIIAVIGGGFIIIVITSRSFVKPAYFELMIIGVVAVWAFSMFTQIYSGKITAKKEEDRVNTIVKFHEDWGENICTKVILRKIEPGMTTEMILLSWGKPTNIDNREITKTGINKERWGYGVPRHGAKYIQFKNGEVTKINL